MLRKPPKGCRYFYICTDLPVMEWISADGQLKPSHGGMFEWENYIGTEFWPWRKKDALERPEQTVLQLCAKTYRLVWVIR